MNNELNRSQDFFNQENEVSESLWKYVQSLSPETISQLSKPESQEVFQVMERNIIGLLGQVHICKGQNVNSRWIKMQDISSDVQLWLIR